jgi:predicted nucleotidyltransferase
MVMVKLVKKLKTLKPLLREKYGIEEFALFGSMSRDDYDAQSDIDIAILKSNKYDLFLRVEAIKFLEQQFQRKVDIGYFNSMKIFIKNRIKKDFIYV